MAFTAPIVGMAFRPPSSKVLSQLPFGAELELRRQPDNQYDPDAVQVFLHGFKEGGKYEELFKQCVDAALPDELPAGRGLWNLGSLIDPLFLGFVAAKTGEAAKLSEWMDREHISVIYGKLCGTLEGKPAVEVELYAPEEASV